MTILIILFIQTIITAILQTVKLLASVRNYRLLAFLSSFCSNVMFGLIFNADSGFIGALVYALAYSLGITIMLTIFGNGRQRDYQAIMTIYNPSNLNLQDYIVLSQTDNQIQVITNNSTDVRNIRNQSNNVVYSLQEIRDFRQ